MSKLKRGKADWVLPGGKSGELGHCTRCGGGLTINLPQPMPIAIAAMKAFVEMHKTCKETGYSESVPKNLVEWMAGRDTGISSMTIASVMAGVKADYYDIPADPDDFGRCYRLLQLCPEFRPRLGEVAAKFPAWKNLVDHWDELTELYEKELRRGSAPKLYARMKELEGEKGALIVWARAQAKDFI